MKKVYIIIFTTILLLITLITVTFNIYNSYSFSGEEVVYTIKSNYTYNVSDNNYIDVLVYSNNPRSVIKEYKGETCSLKDDKILLSGSISEVERLNSYDYKKEKFYSYKLKIKPVDVNITFKMSNCILETHDLNVSIGTLSVVDIKSNSTNPLDFTKIYAVGTDVMGFTTISGFVISIKNKSNYDIKIDEFYIGEYNKVSLSKAKVLDKDITTSPNMDLYIEDYNVYDFSNNIGSLTIEANKTVKFLIPVYYKSKSFLSNTLIYINDQLYIDNFDYLKNYDDLDKYEEILNEATTNFS